MVQFLTCRENDYFDISGKCRDALGTGREKDSSLGLEQISLFLRGCEWLHLRLLDSFKHIDQKRFELLLLGIQMCFFLMFFSLFSASVPAIL